MTINSEGIKSDGVKSGATTNQQLSDHKIGMNPKLNLNQIMADVASPLSMHAPPENNILGPFDQNHKKKKHLSIKGHRLHSIGSQVLDEGSTLVHPSSRMAHMSGIHSKAFVDTQ